MWTLNSKSIETGQDCGMFLPRRKFSLQETCRTQGIECSGLTENGTIGLYIYSVCWIPLGKTVSERLRGVAPLERRVTRLGFEVS